MSIVLNRFEIGPMQNFGYLLGDSESKQALVVDPAWDKQKILAVAEEAGLKIVGLVVTHAHYDHTNIIEELLESIDVPVYAHPLEISYSKSAAGIVGSLGKTVKPMNNEETVKLGDTQVRFLHTPGHTPGSQCIEVGNYLITGDTLFIGGCGRSDLPGGNPKLLFETLRKIARLPSHLQICPGHDYGVVPQRELKKELAENPYLQMQSENQFLHAVT